MALSGAERQRRYRERQQARAAAGELPQGESLSAAAAATAIDGISRRAIAALQQSDRITATEAIRILKLKIEADRLKAASAVNRPTIRPALYDYAREVWPLVASGKALIDTWHMRAMCDHLTALADGRIRHLCVSLPPRLGKSVLCSVVFPSWLWTFDPQLRILSASYADRLASGFSASHRELVKSEWWRERFDVRLSAEMDTRSRFRNSSGGERVSVSVYGSTMGLGGDVLILDDPHHAQEIRSTVEREKTLDWFRTAWTTRADNPNKARHLVVMQRLHQHDLAAALAESGDWSILSLANERPADPCRTGLPWTDPRALEGDLLCPALLDSEETARRRRMLGDEYLAQYQQAPVPPGGALFTRKTIQLLDSIPDEWELTGRVRYWDIAGTAPRAGFDPDWTVGCLMGAYVRPDDGLPIWVVESVNRLRGEPSTVDGAIRATAQTDGPEVEIVEEQEPGASGKHVIDMRRKKLDGYHYRGKRMTGDKDVRFGPISTQTKAGNIVLLRDDWNEALITELCAIPGAKHDDQTDAMSGAFVCLASGPVRMIDDGAF